MKVEIILSTLNDGIFNITLHPDFSYLIIHQITDLSKSKEYNQKSKQLQSLGVRYICSYDVGLSKSRNIGLANSKGKYLWIMDDDVKIHDDAKNRILKYIRDHNADMLVLNHSSNPQLTQDAFIQEKNLNRLSATSVCSINMLIKREAIENIRFDENFGLGSKYPSGEEYIFCCDFLKQHKQIWQTNLVVAYHPPITSGQDFYSTPIKLAAKKNMFIRTHGCIIGSLLYILFIIKKLPNVTKKNGYLINIIKSIKL